MYPFWKVLAGGWEGDMFPVLFSLLAGLSQDSNILRKLVIDGERRNGLHFALAHVFPLRQPVAPSQGGTRCMGIRLRRDNWVSVRYAEGLNSSKSSATIQSTDRHD